jgi:hypothetical protein
LNAGPYATLTDPTGDAVVRRTDQGNNGPVNPSSVLPDLRSITVGKWNATYPATDPFVGSWTNGTGNLVRVDLVFQGLVNPPGPLGLGNGPFNPFEFGPSPVYGFVEFDVDDDRDTGGECWGAESTRYLANVARFGEIPQGPLSQRTAISGAQNDVNFVTAPQIERSGADFSIVLCGCFDPDVISVQGDGDMIFEPGETWVVRGRFFQRAGGYVEASAAFGGSQFGLYDPEVDLRFRHDIGTNRTTVSLVYPLTMVGAGLLAGAPAEPKDLCVSNQTSVEEAIDDVIEGVWPGLTYPSWTMCQQWSEQPASIALDPDEWRVQGLVGTSYSSEKPSGALYVWTDAIGSQRFADFNGDGVRTASDRALFDSAIALIDGTPQDADGQANGVVVLPNFAYNFSVYDLNSDGRIDSADRLLIPIMNPGDANSDCAVNFSDITSILANYGATFGASTSQGPGDANGDHVVNFMDITAVLANWGGGC